MILDFNFAQHPFDEMKILDPKLKTCLLDPIDCAKARSTRSESESCNSNLRLRVARCTPRSRECAELR